MRVVLSLAVVVALVGRAGADARIAPTVLTVPTAFVQPGTSLYLSGGVDHRRGSQVRATASYARLVEVDVGGDSLVHGCDPCAGAARATRAVQTTTAGWKLGLARGSAALAVGVRVPITGSPDARVGQVFTVAGLRLGLARVHLGAAAWATEHRGADGGVVRTRAGAALRPLAGLEWTPTIYPRTTVAADLQWVPELGPTAAATTPRWVFTWGVRYQALAWSDIELTVQHRELDQLGEATVMVRASAILAARPR
ncbi:MAG: hypothetical protein R3B06_23960 [Kofleriaceae bacterium]